jgi:glutathione S-transferase
MVTLEEAEVDYDLKLIRFMRGAHKQPDYLKLNPKGKVPCLVTSEGPLTENTAIARYLASQHKGLLPEAAGPLEDAQITADLAFCSSGLHPIVSRIRVPMFFAEGPEAIGSVKAKGMAAFADAFQVVEDRLAGQDWWYGDTWSIMDAYIFWIWFRSSDGGFDMSAFPNANAHGDRMSQRPAVQRALAKEAELLATLEAEGLVPKLG